MTFIYEHDLDYEDTPVHEKQTS